MRRRRSGSCRRATGRSFCTWRSRRRIIRCRRRRRTSPGIAGRYRDGYTVLRQERYRRLIELDLISKDWKLPAPDRKLGDWRYDLEPPAWDAVPDKEWESAKMEVYAAMVDRMDQGVGPGHGRAQGKRRG